VLPSILLKISGIFKVVPSSGKFKIRLTSSNLFLTPDLKYTYGEECGAIHSQNQKFYLINGFHLPKKRHPENRMPLFAILKNSGY
jgi:hypothetical protein